MILSLFIRFPECSHNNLVFQESSSLNIFKFKKNICLLVIVNLYLFAWQNFNLKKKKGKIILKENDLKSRIVFNQPQNPQNSDLPQNENPKNPQDLLKKRKKIESQPISQKTVIQSALKRKKTDQSHHKKELEKELNSEIKNTLIAYSDSSDSSDSES